MFVRTFYIKKAHDLSGTGSGHALAPGKSSCCDTVLREQPCRFRAPPFTGILKNLILDRNTVIGLVLIFALTIGWAFFTMPSQEEIEQRRAEQAAQDSIAAVLDQPHDPRQEQPQPVPSSQIDTSRAGELAMSQGSEPSLPLGAFSTVSAADTLITTVRTPKYYIQPTNLGGVPIRYTLHDHVTW